MSRRACRRDPERAAEPGWRCEARGSAELHPDALVIGSDTIVHDGERFYEKPESPEDAVSMLMALRGGNTSWRRVWRLISAVANGAT